MSYFFLRQLETPKTQQQGCLKNHGDFPGSPANGMAPTPKAACFVSRWMKPHAVWMDPHGTGGSRVGRITYPIPAWKKEFLDSSRYPSLEWKTWMFPKIEGVLFPPIIHGLNRGFPLFSPSILGYCTTIFGNTYMLVPSRVVY